VLIGGVFILMMTGVAFVVGALSNVYFLQLSGREIGVAGVPAIAAAKGVVKDIIPLYMKEFMPVWLGDIFLIRPLAAAMSTVSSQFHAMGTAMGRDVWETLGGAKSEGGRSLVATRLGIFLTFILAVSLAYILPVHLAKYGAVEIIARSTAIFFALCAATFLPMYVGGLYCRGITKAGAISGALVGFVTSAFWLVFVNDKPAKALGICQWLFGKPSLAIVEGKPLTWLWVDAMIVAFPLALVTTIVVSLATRSFSKEHLDHCFARID
jgi:SSS family solute:Na+ symporter